MAALYHREEEKKKKNVNLLGKHKFLPSLAISSVALPRGCKDLQIWNQVLEQEHSESGGSRERATARGCCVPWLHPHSPLTVRPHSKLLSYYLSPIVHNRSTHPVNRCE